MIKPYTAVGLIPTVRGIRKRADIRINLEHLRHLVKAASWLSALDLPVRSGRDHRRGAALAGTSGHWVTV